jgi:hypothetical protein
VRGRGIGLDCGRPEVTVWGMIVREDRKCRMADGGKGREKSGTRPEAYHGRGAPAGRGGTAAESDCNRHCHGHRGTEVGMHRKRLIPAAELHILTVKGSEGRR